MRRSWWLLAPGIAAVLCAFVSDDDPTYNDDIRPMLAKKCVACHQSGGPSPFPLTTYAEVKKRAALLRWVCIVGTMPPVDADSAISPMAAIEPMRDDELLALQEWVRTGAKEGKPRQDAKHPTEPGWEFEGMRTTLASPNAPKVAIEGAPYRQLFVFETAKLAGRAITNFDIKPKTPFVWRQALLAIVPKGVPPESPFTRTGIGAERIVGAWAPGYFAWTSPLGVTVPPESKLVVWALFQPTGKAEDAGFDLELRTAEPAQASPEWITLGSNTFSVKPADGPETLRSEMTLTEDRDLLSVIPECRTFAQQVRVDATYPGGPTKRVLTIKTWDPNWIGAYQPKERIHFPAGTKLTAEIDYDNSGHSTGNREVRPTTPLKFGPADTDELFWVHLQTIPHVP